ncbi:SdiA-regulated domain-containing protein [Pseudomonas protegens]|uniref:SdiA-regulated domain-containing protein n=1 Tax=Pseudomonas protegens TaxID=380021 RepID=UPI001B3174E0|nr:SdiA-regulated domain-containing protein [Pseudomonas protegens]MBP5101607.1 SdiA-regulated domain-containing protein [Pseudomonas protegens]MBP5119520.1 SdiA-regulated domain-containing protein [Pseudomonas protegens]MBP5126184.1 SdiA-regulated domain-containing protein [Pseudomonas protegens]MBP5132947.1 SdiA-regulated domain-containing protein [Pseudomonas protegens]MBP5150037.1 SdiA-regulated domain-containing protein [Pseudomonas protegens]
MYRLTRLQPLYLILCLMAVLLAVFVHNHRLWQRAWFDWQSYWQVTAPQSLGLGDYRVVLEAQPIEGLDEVSALTYDPLRNSLFTVTNKNSELIELSLDGQILRRIALVGFGDPEAVEFISANTYVISDERQHRLIKIQLDDETTAVDAAEAEQITLGVHLAGNKGFEGLAYDSQGKRLFVAKERDPMLIYEVQGFPHQDPGQSYGMHVVNNPKRDAGLFVRDLSSLQYDERSGHLLALSDESRLVVELDVEGRPLSTLALGKWRQGLSKAVPQAEGMAMDDAGTLYLVSEPNLFYVFKKPM